MEHDFQTSQLFYHMTWDIFHGRLLLVYYNEYTVHEIA